MTGRTRLTARLTGEEAVPPAESQPASDSADATPYDKLMRAAQNGQYEALVAKARPAEPPAMVTPEEREAELRASGRWPADKRRASKPKPSKAEPPPPEAPPPEPTANDLYIAETCRWRLRGPNDYAPKQRIGRCLTEYDVLADEGGYDVLADDDDYDPFADEEG